MEEHCAGCGHKFKMNRRWYNTKGRFCPDCVRKINKRTAIYLHQPYYESTMRKINRQSGNEMQSRDDTKQKEAESILLSSELARPQP